MGAQELSVITLRTMGLDCPCTVTMLAIWMTGSFSASGKHPCRRQELEQLASCLSLSLAVPLA